MSKSYLFLANGFEEMEALCTVDILRRAGIDVATVSINDTLTVTGAHGVNVVADTLFDDSIVANPDWLILPGGMPGAENLYNCSALRELLLKQNARRGNIAAICASPAVVLAQLNLLKGHKATCYPGFENVLGAEVYIDRKVVEDGNIITGNGPGSSMDFALTIVAKQCGQQKADSIANDLLIYPHDPRTVEYNFG
ncbi:MAG: DJ-1/PfpI family protein [Muribaculaceae bacterium]|nr:DJ-1/PfpI family protein [Muribaculaceae bacterium]